MAGRLDFKYRAAGEDKNGGGRDGRTGTGAARRPDRNRDGETAGQGLLLYGWRQEKGTQSLLTSCYVQNKTRFLRA